MGSRSSDAKVAAEVGGSGVAAAMSGAVEAGGAGKDAATGSDGRSCDVRVRGSCALEASPRDAEWHRDNVALLESSPELDRVSVADSASGMLAAQASRGGIKMARNVGNIDRVVRAWVGIALIALVFVGPKSPLGLIGLVPLVTSIWGFCPLYKLLGLDTCNITAHRGA